MSSSRTSSTPRPISLRSTTSGTRFSTGSPCPSWPRAQFVDLRRAAVHRNGCSPCAARPGSSFHQPFDISLPQKDITPDTPLHVGPAVFDLLDARRLARRRRGLPRARAGLEPGPARADEAAGAAARPRACAQLPRRTGAVHQDLGVLLPEADSSTILSCWVAVTDADEENGCMQVAPREPSAAPSTTTARPSRRPASPSTSSRSTTPWRCRCAAGACSSSGRTSSTARSTTRATTVCESAWISATSRPASRAGGPHFPSFLARSEAHPGAGAARSGRVGGDVVRGARCAEPRRDPGVHALARRRTVLRVTVAAARLPELLDEIVDIVRVPPPAIRRPRSCGCRTRWSRARDRVRGAGRRRRHGRASPRPSPRPGAAGGSASSRRPTGSVGQLTSQGVSALDEHDLIESFGGTASYYGLRQAIRDHYDGARPRSAPGRATPARAG